MLSQIGIDIFFSSMRTQSWADGEGVFWEELEEGMHMIKVILHKILKELIKKEKE